MNEIQTQIVAQKDVLLRRDNIYLKNSSVCNVFYLLSHFSLSLFPSLLTPTLSLSLSLSFFVSLSPHLCLSTTFSIKAAAQYTTNYTFQKCLVNTCLVVIVDIRNYILIFTWNGTVSLTLTIIFESCNERKSFFLAHTKWWHFASLLFHVFTHIACKRKTIELVGIIQWWGFPNKNSFSKLTP